MKQFRTITGWVGSILLIAKLIKLGSTPAFWDALLTQIHAPRRIGTVDTNTIIDVGGTYFLTVLIGYYALRAAYTIARRTNMSLVDEMIEAAAFFPSSARRWWQRRNPTYRAAARTRCERIYDTAATDLGFTPNPHNREHTITTMTTMFLNPLEPSRPNDNTLRRHAISDLTKDHEDHTTRIVASGPLRTGLPEHLGTIVEAFGGRWAPTSGTDQVGVCAWPHPPTAYAHMRLRLMCAAIPLVVCETPGQNADRIHTNLTDLCRLASYQGYMVSGSTNPDDIERATIRECQALIRVDMLASVPDLEIV